MKRLLAMLLLAAALLAGCSKNADVTVSGQYDFTVGYVNTGAPR